MFKPILFATLLYLVTSECLPMKCMDDTEENKDKCKETSISELGKTVLVKKCGTGKTCTPLSGTKFFCDIDLKKVGEKCNDPDECYSKNCENKVCVAKTDGTSCEKHAECGKNSYCDLSVSRTCSKLLNENDPCTNSYECPFGYTCGLIDTQNESKRCLKMYQVEDGKFSSSEELCKSNYLSTSYICSTYTAVKPEQECKTDSDCPIKEKDSEEEITISGQCVCNYNTGKNLCQYSYEKSEVKNYREKLISYHTTLSNAGEYPVLAKLSPSYNIKKAEFSGSIQYKDAAQCVLDYFASSSSWVKVSFLALVSILLF